MSAGEAHEGGADAADAREAVWIDCDPGHDDMLAIILAGHSSSLRVLGVSTVHGNQTVIKTALNAARTLVFAGLEQIDVVQGAAAPLVRPARACPEIHGDTGLDGTALLPPADHPAVQARLERWRGRKAAVVMAEEILLHPDPVTVVATGALTNVALALILYGDELKAKIGRIVIMGGAIGVGNINPVAEFNMLVDPEAAHVVCEAGAAVDFTMVPLEVTHTALITSEVEAAVRARCAPRFAQCVLELLAFFKSTYHTVFRMECAPCHDPCAVAYLLDPGRFTARRMRVDVELKSDLAAGQTVCDVYGFADKPANARVATAVDVAWFWKAVVDALARASDAERWSELAGGEPLG